MLNIGIIYEGDHIKHRSEIKGSVCIKIVSVSILKKTNMMYLNIINIPII